MAYQEKSGIKSIDATKLTANDSTAQQTLGTLRELADGRKFRYIKMTGSALALGQIVMPATKVAVTNATSANGVGPDGATTTIITDSDAAWTPGAYEGWYFQVATGMTGSTEPIKIVANSVTTLTLEKQITTALSSAGTDDGEILAGTAAGILSTANDLDVDCLGVGIGTITQNYYGWVQVAGPAAVVSDAITEGDKICPGGNAAGQGIAMGDYTDNAIGVCVAASGTDEYCFVDLRIA